MIPLPRLEFYLRPRVTLTFDLLTPKVDRLMILMPFAPCTICAILHQNRFFVFKLSCSRVKQQTNGRTDGQPENIMPPPASFAWRRHKDVQQVS